MSDYKHPEVLVSTDWAAHNLKFPNLRFVEADVGTTAYDQGHIPGALARRKSWPSSTAARKASVSTFAASMSSREEFLHLPVSPKRRNAPATFPRPRISLGPRPLQCPSGEFINKGSRCSTR